MNVKRFRIVQVGSGRDRRAIQVEVYQSQEEIMFAIDTSIERCTEILDTIDGMVLDDFLMDKKAMKSVAMDMLSIGNFMKEMPGEILAFAPQLEQAYGFRCIIAHDYGNTNFDYPTLWDAATHDVKPMMDALLRARNVILREGIRFQD